MYPDDATKIVLSPLQIVLLPTTLIPGGGTVSTEMAIGEEYKLQPYVSVIFIEYKPVVVAV